MVTIPPVDGSETASGCDELSLLFWVAYTEEISRAFRLGPNADPAFESLLAAVSYRKGSDEDYRGLIGAECAASLQFGPGMKHPRIVEFHAVDELDDNGTDEWCCGDADDTEDDWN